MEIKDPLRILRAFFMISFGIVLLAMAILMPIKTYTDFILFGLTIFAINTYVMLEILDRQIQKLLSYMEKFASPIATDDL